LIAAPAIAFPSVAIPTGAVAIATHRPTAIPSGAEMKSPGQHDKPLLLPLVQGLVQRLRGIGELLERRCRSGHQVGAASQSLDRVRRRHRISRRLPALIPHFDEVADRQLEGAPVFLLVRRQLQSGLQTGDTGIEKCRAVVGRMLSAVAGNLWNGRLLCVSKTREHHDGSYRGKNGL
jgi:hypothetical protein